MDTDIQRELFKKLSIKDPKICHISCVYRIPGASLEVFHELMSELLSTKTRKKEK